MHHIRQGAIAHLWLYPDRLPIIIHRRSYAEHVKHGCNDEEERIICEVPAGTSPVVKRTSEFGSSR